MERNTQFLKRWVEKLRSNEFDQTVERLRYESGEDDNTPEGFCCLGVACHISRKVRISKTVSYEVRGGSKEYYYQWDDNPDSRESSLLPHSFREWIGLTEKEHKHLYKMNDAGLSFSQIADWIEDNIIGEEPDTYELYWDYFPDEKAPKTTF